MQLCSIVLRLDPSTWIIARSYFKPRQEHSQSGAAAAPVQAEVTAGVSVATARGPGGGGASGDIWESLSKSVPEGWEEEVKGWIQSAHGRQFDVLTAVNEYTSSKQYKRMKKPIVDWLVDALTLGGEREIEKLVAHGYGTNTIFACLCPGFLGSITHLSVQSRQQVQSWGAYAHMLTNLKYVKIDKQIRNRYLMHHGKHAHRDSETYSDMSVE
eukprot:GDKI01048335.1.p1 GENE.GDKI01048335.1~~GDKI01048335.1.p1  ORF type:complete len:213 (-),score=23.65 GDKI01048335.1:158-796(-)